MMMIIVILKYIYYIVTTLAMIYSIYLWVKKGYTDKQKFFFIYLILVFIVDIIGVLYIRKTFKIPQTYLFFPLVIFSILYFRYFYIQDYKTKKDHYFLNVVTVISIGMSFYLQFSIQHFAKNLKPQSFQNQGIALFFLYFSQVRGLSRTLK